MIIGGAVYFFIAALALAIVFFFLSSVVSLGYSKFNLDLVYWQREPELNTLFDYFHYLQKIFVTKMDIGYINKQAK